MKKILVVLSAIIVALLITGIYIFKNQNNEINENLPELNKNEVVVEESSFTDNDEQEADTAEIKDQKNKTQIFNTSKNKQKSPIKNNRNQSVNAPANINTEQYSEAERKLTPEEEELVKKVPPAKEVIVDKEIKIKSSGKYIFK